MPEREHFTNFRCLIFGTGFALMGTSFGAQIGGWAHWVTIGIGYGIGIALMLVATALITKSYFSRQPEHREEAIPDKRNQRAAQDTLSPQIKDMLSIRPVSAQDLLTPLQMDALVLARDLRQLSREMGPKSHPDWKEPKVRWEHSDARADADIREWNTAFAARYKNQFSGRTVAILRKIAEEIGIEDPWAKQLCNGLLDGVDKVEQIKALVGVLTSMVAQIENKK
jgi:hypothetical protein